MKPLFVDTSGRHDLLFPGAPKHGEIVKLMRSAIATDEHFRQEGFAALP